MEPVAKIKSDLAEMINSKKLIDEVETREVMVNRQDFAQSHSDSGYDPLSENGDGNRSEGHDSLSDRPPSVNSAENNIENQPAEHDNQIGNIEEEK